MLNRIYYGNIRSYAFHSIWNFVCNYQVKKGNSIIAEFTKKEDALMFIEAYSNYDKRTNCKLIENINNLE